jgi:penicillin-binding protein 1C
VLERHGAANVAVVVLDNAAGEWLAWEGSGDYFDSARGGTIDGARAPRQPGSALKPFTYALAFELGFTPATVLPDIPSHFPTADPGVLYTPRNYDGRYRGPMLVRRALAGSENVPAVAVASELGVPSLIRFLQRAGLTTFDRNASYYGLGVTLGNAEVRLDELVAAYSTFARGGVWIAPASVLSGAVGRNLSSAGTSDTRERRRLVSHRAAFWISDILSDHEAREFIFGRGGSLEFPFPVAVKTGTSQAYHDNWTIGYTRAVTVGVWVGNFNRTPLRQSSGVTGAAPIFHAVMLAAEKRFGGRTEILLDADASVVKREICALSGALANTWCPTKQREWLVVDGDEPPCAWHHLADEGLLTIWPAEYRQWAKQNGRLEAEGLESRVAGVVGRNFPGRRSPGEGGSSAAPAARPSRAALEITSPPSGAAYLIDPTLRREFQALPLRVVASRPGRISWSIDGRPLGTSHSDAALMWSLATGAHRIVATDEHGRRAETTVVVK